jgi:NADPH:quinone reductase-like Zn-dependent oxidoreductase
MARHTGAVVYATVGTASKVAPLRALGADAVIEHRREDFAAAVEQLTGGEGVDLVMDFVGGAFLARNLAVLRPGGCLVAVGLFDGYDASIDLLAVVERRLQLKGSSLRLRPMIEKREVNRRYRERWMAVIERGELRPVLHAVYPLAEIRAAQAEMEANRNVGKIVLELA